MQSIKWVYYSNVLWNKIFLKVTLLKVWTWVYFNMRITWTYILFGFKTLLKFPLYFILIYYKVMLKFNLVKCYMNQFYMKVVWRNGWHLSCISFNKIWDLPLETKVALVLYRVWQVGEGLCVQLQWPSSMIKVAASQRWIRSRYTVIHSWKPEVYPDFPSK